MSTRLYRGTIAPGGSISSSQADGGTLSSRKPRPFTTPIPPRSSGTFSNTMTVLSSDQRAGAGRHVPDDDDTVVVEEEVVSEIVTPQKPDRGGGSARRRSSGASSASGRTSSASSVHSLSGRTPTGGRYPTSTDTSPGRPAGALGTLIGSQRARPVINNSLHQRGRHSSRQGPGAPSKAGSGGQARNRYGAAADGPRTKPQPKGQLVSRSAPGAAELRRRPNTASTSVRHINLGRKELLGKGSFGMVYKGIDVETNKLLAVKEISLVGSNIQQLPAIKREIALMQKLDHPNIVKCLGQDCDDQYLRIYMEYVAGGSVSSNLRNFGPFQERQASILTGQVLAGLQYLHDRKIVHRDLKGDNLLMDTFGTLKLADFGTAKELATQAMSVAGTAYFMAPEVIKGIGHGTEADVWSVGCCVIEMLTGRPPFSNLQNQYAIMMHVAESDAPLDDIIPKNASAALGRFLRRCIIRDPKKRATSSQLLKEEWIVNPPENTVASSVVLMPQDIVDEVDGTGESSTSHKTSQDSRGLRRDSTSANDRGNKTSTARKTSTTSATGSRRNSRQSGPVSTFNPLDDADCGD